MIPDIYLPMVIRPHSCMQLQVQTNFLTSISWSIDIGKLALLTHSLKNTANTLKSIWNLFYGIQRLLFDICEI